MRVKRILETTLYVRDLEAAEAFYTTVLGLEVAGRMGDRGLTFRCGDAVLLVFDPKSTRAAGSEVPAHGAEGPGHVAFVLEEDAIHAWRDRLAQHEIAVEAEVDWPAGGTSLYFRDPAGNSIELAPATLWWPEP
jgi:catechol 2,3-dioxygenase-like lactoylglutathione lyase family enzyme